jgi:hypothetical protein
MDTVMPHMPLATPLVSKGEGRLTSTTLNLHHLKIHILRSRRQQGSQPCLQSTSPDMIATTMGSLRTPNILHTRTQTLIRVRLHLVLVQLLLELLPVHMVHQGFNLLP